MHVDGPVSRNTAETRNGRHKSKRSNGKERGNYNQAPGAVVLLNVPATC